MLKNRDNIIALREKSNKELDLQDKKILVCAGTGCVAGGSIEIYNELIEIMDKNDHPCSVVLEEENEKTTGIKKSGCHGFCEKGPLVRIEPWGYLYMKVKPEDCREIFEETILKGRCIERLTYKMGKETFNTQDNIPFYKKQTRTVLGNCGHIDATSMDEYIANGGYMAFEKALFDMKPDDIVEEINDANLRGRGGGGFPAGRKWKQVKAQQEKIRYIVCNGDEGDPGAFMDRSIMEGDPHSLLEGMLIAAVATNATEGYIYVRAEYPLAIERLETAITQAREHGLLGKDILGSGFSFNIKINKGAGAFVCGEGSALTESIQGKRGMPRVKPPRTVEQGLFGKPTVLNNVETYVNVPLIVRNGAKWFRGIGTEDSPGTKAFALTGNIENTGLIEVPMGTTLREIIFDIGGGMRGGKKFKAVQIGGPSGGCLTEKHLDLPLDFDSLQKEGTMIGSGGLVVMDEDTCMVEVARFFMNFTQKESCGKCVPCREGTHIMLEIINDITEGRGSEDQLDMLLELAEVISKTALCGLGKTAPSPVVSTIKQFEDEYRQHIVDKRCATGTCQSLAIIRIEEDKCKGCTKCIKSCPVNAIEGTVKNPHTIDREKCIKCKVCINACPFDAIVCDY